MAREAITRDLEDMKRSALSGFTLWNTQEGTPAGPVKYASEAWWVLLEHTMKEAERLGRESPGTGQNETGNSASRSGHQA